MNTLRFDDRVIIITGGGAGLGEAYARELAGRGAHTVLVDMSDRVQTVAAEISASGARAIAVKGSVTEYGIAETAVKAALETFGRVDGLINNAGIGFEKPFAETPIEDMRRLIDVHLFGAINFTKAVWAPMAEAGYGRILNITSAAIFGLAGWSSYSAAKAAQLSLARTLAIEAKGTGISINSLAPSAFTDMPRRFITDPAILETQKEATAEMVAPVAAFLLHEQNSYNGASFFTSKEFVAEIVLGTSAGEHKPNLSIDDVEQILARQHETAIRLFADTYEQTDHWGAASIS